MPTFHVPQPGERPDVEVLIDGLWWPSELRMWIQGDDGAWTADVSTGSRVSTRHAWTSSQPRTSARTTLTAHTGGAERPEGVITKREYRAVRKNMTLRRVTRITGAAGRTTSDDSMDWFGDWWRTVYFRQCHQTWSHSYISLTFRKQPPEPFRLMEKHADWSSVRRP